MGGIGEEKIAIETEGKLAMKKKWCFFIIVFLLCVNNSYALAGDAEWLVYANVEPQDALLIGEVVKKENDNILDIKILRVVCGEVKDSQIKYDNPIVAKRTSVGKYLLLSVEKEENIYKKCYSVCHEVTIKKGDKISDLKPLDEEDEELEELDELDELDEEDEELDGEWEMLLQWFCNTGTTINESPDDSGKYYEEDEVGVTDTLVYDMNEHKWYKDPLSDEYPSPNTQELEITNYIILGGLLIVVFVGIGVGIRFYRRKKGKNVEKDLSD